MNKDRQKVSRGRFILQAIVLLFVGPMCADADELAACYACFFLSLLFSNHVLHEDGREKFSSYFGFRLSDADAMHGTV